MITYHVPSVTACASTSISGITQQTWLTYDPYTPNYNTKSDGSSQSLATDLNGTSYYQTYHQETLLVNTFNAGTTLVVTGMRPQDAISTSWGSGSNFNYQWGQSYDAGEYRVFTAANSGTTHTETQYHSYVGYYSSTFSVFTIVLWTAPPFTITSWITTTMNTWGTTTYSSTSDNLTKTSSSGSGALNTIGLLVTITISTNNTYASLLHTTSAGSTITYWTVNGGVPTVTSSYDPAFLYSVNSAYTVTDTAGTSTTTTTANNRASMATAIIPASTELLWKQTASTSIPTDLSVVATTTTGDLISYQGGAFVYPQLPTIQITQTAYDPSHPATITDRQITYATSTITYYTSTSTAATIDVTTTSSSIATTAVNTYSFLPFPSTSTATARVSFFTLRSTTTASLYLTSRTTTAAQNGTLTTVRAQLNFYNVSTGPAFFSSGNVASSTSAARTLYLTASTFGASTVIGGNSIEQSVYAMVDYSYYGESTTSSALAGQTVQTYSLPTFYRDTGSAVTGPVIGFVPAPFAGFRSGSNDAYTTPYSTFFGLVGNITMRTEKYTGTTAVGTSGTSTYTTFTYTSVGAETASTVPYTCLSDNQDVYGAKVYVNMSFSVTVSKSYTRTFTTPGVTFNSTSGSSTTSRFSMPVTHVSSFSGNSVTVTQSFPAVFSSAGSYLTSDGRRNPATLLTSNSTSFQVSLAGAVSPFSSTYRTATDVLAMGGKQPAPGQAEFYLIAGVAFRMTSTVGTGTATATSTFLNSIPYLSLGGNSWGVMSSAATSDHVAIEALKLFAAWSTSGGTPNLRLIGTTRNP